MSTRVLSLAIAAVLFGAGILAGLSFTGRQEHPPAPALQAATYLAAGRPLQEFELVAANGGPLRNDELRGSWTIVFMGFTNCGHTCPMTLFTLSEAVRQLERRPQVLFVSVDPDRDTPEIIGNYLAGFDPAFRGATGASPQLDRLAESLGAPYRVSAEDGRYTVDHSGALFVIDPEGSFRALLSPPHDAEVIAADLGKILATG